jgi:hypothetical protein
VLAAALGTGALVALSAHPAYAATSTISRPTHPVALGVDANGTPHTVSLAVAVDASPTSLPVTGVALSTMLAVALTSIAGGVGLLFAGRARGGPGSSESRASALKE